MMFLMPKIKVSFVDTAMSQKLDIELFNIKFYLLVDRESQEPDINS